MKEFNLEEAKAGNELCARDGSKARIVCFDAKGEYPIIALIENVNGKSEYPVNLNIEGKGIFSFDGFDDLMMK